MIHCRTLGPVEASVDGAAAPAELLWRKNLALLVYLARSPKRTRTRDHLIGLLWADKPEEAARHSLNVALGVLRRHAGEGGLDSDAEQIRVAAGAVELDLDRFDALAAAQDFRGAAELVQGEFLEGFGVRGASDFENWVAAEREAWRVRSIDVLTRRAEELLQAGDVVAAGQTAQRALALDRHSERAVRTAMRARTLAGDRAAALACFEELARRLAELGTAPDAETQALADRVRRERAWRLPQREPQPAEESAARPGPLAGRAAELERLLAVWADSRRGRRPAVCIITGDSGTGKSRLAEEVLARARLEGAATAAIRAVEADQSDAWSGVVGLARGGLLDAPGVAAAPPAALTALRAGPSPALGRAFSDVLAAVCDEQPVLLLLDDAHWLDRESLLAVVAALRDLAGAPLTVLLTTNPQPARAELDEMRARLGRDLAGAAVRLGPLGPAALQDLARWALPRYDEVQIDRVTRRVAVDSAGVPLLAIALLQAVASGLELRESPGAWPEPLRTLDQTLPGELPDAVVAAIRVEFRRRSADAQHLLVAAAVLADRVPAAHLGQATGFEDERLTAALDELEWHRWLAAEPRGYAFVARIVRDVIERDMVTPGQRQRLLAAAAAQGR